MIVKKDHSAVAQERVLYQQQQFCADCHSVQLGSLINPIALRKANLGAQNSLYYIRCASIFSKNPGAQPRIKGPWMIWPLLVFSLPLSNIFQIYFQDSALTVCKIALTLAWLCFITGWLNFLCATTALITIFWQKRNVTKQHKPQCLLQVFQVVLLLVLFQLFSYFYSANSYFYIFAINAIHLRSKQQIFLFPFVKHMENMEVSKSVEGHTELQIRRGIEDNS